MLFVHPNVFLQQNNNPAGGAVPGNVPAAPAAGQANPVLIPAPPPPPGPPPDLEEEEEEEELGEEEDEGGADQGAANMAQGNLFYFLYYFM